MHPRSSSHPSSAVLPGRRLGAWLAVDATGPWADAPATTRRALRAVLTGGGPRGAVLIGDGADRRAVIEAALTDAGPDRVVYRIHGSAFASGIRFGALAILLSALPDEPAADQHGIVRALSGLLGTPGGEPAIVIVSQVGLLDAGTVSVLAQLAQMDRIVLVVQCDSASDVPAELESLVREAELMRITVAPLTPAAAQPVLERILEGPVSRYALTVLWNRSGGSYSRLRALARDCVTSGALWRTPAGWVLVPEDVPGPPRDAVEPAILRDLPPRQRALLELLAICGPLRVADLSRTGSAPDIDELLATGAVQLGSDRDGRFVEVDAVRAAEIMVGFDEERRRELAGTLQAIDPGRRTIIRTVEQLVSRGEPSAAAALLRDARSERSGTIPPDALVRLTWTEARALMQLGRRDSAADLLMCSPVRDHPPLQALSAWCAASFGQPEATEGGPLRDAEPGDEGPAGTGTSHSSTWCTAETVRFVDEVARALRCAATGEHGRALDILERLDAEFAGYRTAGVTDVIPAFERAALTASVLDVLLLCGRFADCRDTAESLLAGTHRNPYAAQYAELVVALLDARGGRDEAAVRRAGLAAAQYAEGGDPRLRRLARAIVRYVENDPGRADEPSANAHGADPEGAGEAGCRDWFADLLRGWSDPDDAADGRRTDVLCRAADRAAAAGQPGVELLAVSAAVEWGTVHLAPRLGTLAARSDADHAPLHAALARAVEADDPAAIATAMEDLAARGLVGHRNLVRSPLLAALPPMKVRSIADAAESARVGLILPSARPSPAGQAVPIGLTAPSGPSSPRGRSASGRPPQGAGASPAVRRAASGAHPGGGLPRDGRIRLGRAVQPLEGARRPETQRPTEPTNTPTPAWMEPLTRREREISEQVVDGRANAVIARLSGISVRTVEGHLGQIYAKLQVKGRTGLIRLAQEHSAAVLVP